MNHRDLCSEEKKKENKKKIILWLVTKWLLYRVKATVTTAKCRCSGESLKERKKNLISVFTRQRTYKKMDYKDSVSE